MHRTSSGLKRSLGRLFPVRLPNGSYLFWYNEKVKDSEKPLFWIGSSKKDLITLPIPVRKFFGHALNFAQNGEQHDAAKVLKGFGHRSAGGCRRRFRGDVPCRLHR